MKKLLAIVLLLFSSCQPSAAPKHQAKAMKPAQYYRQLVAGLVSPNQPLKLSYDSFRETARITEIPANYDWQAQRRIASNRQVLIDDCEEAMPFLAEACTDTRFSLTQRGEDWYGNWSVSKVCAEIVAKHAEVFRDYMSFTGPGEWHAFDFVPRIETEIGDKVPPSEAKALHEWWRTHQRMSIHSLQLEAFDWAIEKRKNWVKEPAGYELPDVHDLIEARDKLQHTDVPLPPPRSDWGAKTEP